jgi:hypothetical protein
MTLWKPNEPVTTLSPANPVSHRPGSLIGTVPHAVPSAARYLM